MAFNLGLIKPEEPRNGRDTAQMIIGEITDMRYALRPRHQRLDVSRHCCIRGDRVEAATLLA